MDRGQMLAQSMSKMEPSDLVVAALLTSLYRRR